MFLVGVILFFWGMFGLVVVTIQTYPAFNLGDRDRYNDLLLSPAIPSAIAVAVGLYTVFSS
jgi:hypothetical protein